MARMLMSGNEAIARGAWEAGVSVGVGYPGTPSTEVLENLVAQRRRARASGLPTRRSPLEVAVGASLRRRARAGHHEARGPERGRRSAVHAATPASPAAS